MLNEIDDLQLSNKDRLSKVDLEISDLLHLIENESLSENASYNVVKKLAQLRKQRRALRNEYELQQLYKQQKKDLYYRPYREKLGQALMEKLKYLNSEYKNRILNEDDIDNLKYKVSPSKQVINETEKPQKKRKHRASKEELEQRERIVRQRLSENVPLKDIAKEVGMTYASFVTYKHLLLANKEN